MHKNLLTEQEQILMDKISDVWNTFLKLKTVHPDETDEFRYMIHTLQHLIMPRPQAKYYYKDVMGEEWIEIGVD